MGAWDSKPFGNDTALDWLIRLKSSVHGPSHIASAVDAILQASTPDASGAEEAIAAAALIAAAAFEPIRGVPNDAKTWIATHAFVPTREMISNAIAALERIMAESELRELWQESEDLQGWLKHTSKLIERLRSALGTQAPTRAPKRPSVPRALGKLVELKGVEANETLRALIRAKLLAIQDVNRRGKDTNWDTPLCLLARTALVEEALLLIARGADPNTDGIITSPLTIACKSGQAAMAKALLDAGANLFKEVMVDARTGQTMSVGIEKQNAQPQVFRYSPALYAAAQSGSPATIDLLLSRGADINQVDLNGETLLHKAAEGGNVQTLVHLISLGLHVNRAKPRSLESPLHYAVRARQLEAVAVLLDNAANPNWLTANSQSPLHFAAMGNAIECARVLLEHEANANIVDEYGCTPLDYAEHSQHPSCELLRKFGGKRGAEFRGAERQ